MSLPKPLPGLVIRYNYLWAGDARDNRIEGEKARPVAVVMAVESPGGSDIRVYALPITHSQPNKETVAMEIPAVVARAAGLDSASSWVILSEFNEFAWPGFDLEPIPERVPRTMAYGFLTPAFFAKLRDRWLALDAAGKSHPVPRDE